MNRRPRRGGISPGGLIGFDHDNGLLALLASGSVAALAALFYFFVTMGTAGP